MELIIEAIKKAIIFLISFDKEIYDVLWRTLCIAISSTIISSIIGIFFATIISLNEFPGKTIIIGMVNTGMGIPPVIAGLFTTLLLWRSGAFGEFELLYTPFAMVIAQVFIATPMVVAIAISALQQIPKNFRLQIRALGASKMQMLFILYRQAKLPLLAAIMAGFGSVVSEVGASIMVGGNIKGYTRVLTTAIVMETSRGNFAKALAFGIILFILSFAVNFFLSYIQQKGRQK